MTMLVMFLPLHFELASSYTSACVLSTTSYTSSADIAVMYETADRRDADTEWSIQSICPLSVFSPNLQEHLQVDNFEDMGFDAASNLMFHRQLHAAFASNNLGDGPTKYVVHAPKFSFHVYFPKALKTRERNRKLTQFRETAVTKSINSIFELIFWQS